MSSNKKHSSVKPTYQPNCNDITQQSISCCVVGDDGIGKTSLLESIGEYISSNDNNSNNDSDIIFRKYNANITSRKGDNISIIYNKCPSSDEYSRIRSLSYRNTQLFFLCFSTINRNSFENILLQWYPEINMISPETPIYLIGTHIDVRNEIISSGTSSIQEIVSQKEGEDLCKRIDAIQYLEITIDDYSCITFVLKQIGEALLRQYDYNTNISSNTNITSWKKISNQKTCLSPREKHKKDIRKRRKKESVAIIQKHKISSPIHKSHNSKLTKMNYRKSILPLSFDDNICIKEQENININPNSSLSSSSLKLNKNPSSSSKYFSLKQFRNCLIRITRRNNNNNNKKDIEKKVKPLESW